METQNDESPRTLARLQALTGMIPEFVVIYGVDGIIRWASNSACEFAGKTLGELVGKPASVMVHPDDIEPLVKLVSQRLRGLTEGAGELPGPRPTVIGKVMAASGVYRWVETTFVLIQIGNDIEVMTTSRDVHDRKIEMDRLTELALVDDLTGLSNRHGLFAAINEMVGRDEPFSVLFCDLDDFKSINDTYGHRNGDLVLRQVARRIQASVRPHDVVARMGGDEFLVALRHCVQSEAVEIAQRIISKIAEPVLLDDDVLVTPSVSVGLSQAAGQMRSTPEELIDAADHAMYRAKNTGNGQLAVSSKVQ